jgi:hypothetical protein
MFKRKRKLSRGRAVWRSDSDARWLIKNTKRYAAQHHRIAKRLKWRQGSRVFVLPILAFVFMLALVPVLFLGYIYIMPTNMIAQVVSPHKAAWVDSLRRSGCVNSYVRYKLFPLIEEHAKYMPRLREYVDCANRNMDFPA